MTRLGTTRSVESAAVAALVTLLATLAVAASAPAGKAAMPAHPLARLGTIDELRMGVGSESTRNARPAAEAEAPRSQVPVFVLDRGRFVTFDPPGAQANELVDINSRDQVAGTYIDTDGTTNRGFLRDERGRTTLFDYPGATGTFVNKVNDRGEIVGNYVDQAGARHGYLRDAKGRFSTVRVPGAVSTQAVGLDDRGRVVGDYTLPDGSIHGYVWENRRVTTVDGPEHSGATLTGINERGDIIGVYAPDPANPAARLAGFLLRKGRYSTIALPDAPFTLPFDINNRGQMAGFTADALPLPDATAVHGFVLREGPGGPVTPIDVPGAPATLASGIDDRGRVAGLYLNPNTTPLDALPLGQRKETR